MLTHWKRDVAKTSYLLQVYPEGAMAHVKRPDGHFTTLVLVLVVKLPVCPSTPFALMNFSGDRRRRMPAWWTAVRTNHGHPRC